MRDRKGRGGKTVTVIHGVMGSEAELSALAQQLKKLCGSGGTAKDGNIEIQGDHCDKVMAKLICSRLRAAPFRAGFLATRRARFPLSGSRFVASLKSASSFGSNTTPR